MPAFHAALRHTSLFLLALWWGGLTFYSAFVVPIGAERIGASDQGFVTRDVTQVLNGLGVITALTTAFPAYFDRNRLLLLAASALLASLALLIPLHFHLDSLLDHSQASVIDSEQFYFWHRLYLIGTTLQWFIGGACLIISRRQTTAI